MKTKILTLSLLSAASLNANAEFVGIINSSVVVSDTNPPVFACVGPELSRSDLDTMIANNDDVTKACVSTITDMSNLFTGYDQFNQDISNWDTSSVKTMQGMFVQPMALKSTFNHDLSKWDVSNVENFSEMFLTHVDYDYDLSSWDTTSATSFEYFISLHHSKMDMTDIPTNFRNSKIQPPFTRSDLDSNLMNSSPNRVFEYADVSQVTDFNRLFSYKTFTADISNWDVSSGINFEYMFSDTKNFNGDISNWDVSKGTNFIGMFQYNQFFDQDISNWNTTKVTDSFYYSQFRFGAILQHKHIPLSFQ